jgi:uncharacterized protein YciW
MSIEITDEIADIALEAYLHNLDEGRLEAMRIALTAVAPLMQAKVPDGWRETFAELLEDYAGARAETAVWNTTQCVQPKAGMRMPRPRLAKLMAHVDLLAAAPEVQS